MRMDAKYRAVAFSSLPLAIGCCCAVAAVARTQMATRIAAAARRISALSSQAVANLELTAACFAQPGDAYVASPTLGAPAADESAPLPPGGRWFPDLPLYGPWQGRSPQEVP